MGGTFSKRQSNLKQTCTSKVQDTHTCYHMNEMAKVSLFPQLRNPYHEHEFVIAIQDVRNQVIDVFYTDDNMEQVTKRLQIEQVPYIVNHTQVHTLWNKHVFERDIDVISVP